MEYKMKQTSTASTTTICNDIEVAASCVLSCGEEKEEDTSNQHLKPPHDQSKGEQIRDKIIDILDTKLFQYLGIFVLFCIIIDGAFFFFLLVGWHTMCDGDYSKDDSNNNNDCPQRNWYLNMSIQILTILFTYMATISITWRFTNFIHLIGLSCPYRKNDVGLDLYGQPTTEEIIWFHIPTRPRLWIIIQLLGNCITQYINQITRIIYWTYEESTGSIEAIILTNLFFGLSFILGLTGGLTLLYYDHKVRKSSQNPSNRFGPSPIDIVKSYLCGGSCCCCTKQKNTDEKQQQQQQQQQDCNNKVEEEEVMTVVYCSSPENSQEQKIIEVSSKTTAAVAAAAAAAVAGVVAEKGDNTVVVSEDEEDNNGNEVKTQTQTQEAATSSLIRMKKNVTPLFDRNEMRLFAL